MKKILLLIGGYYLFVGLISAQPTNSLAFKKKINTLVEEREDNSCIIDSTICFQFNEDLETLLPYIREVTLETNPFGNITKKRIDNYDIGESRWRTSTLLLYTYDGVENLTETVEQNWNTAIQTFDNHTKTTYTLNSHGQATLIVRQTWANNSWKNDEQESYQYEEGPLAGSTLFLFQKWDNQLWVNQFRVLSTYNGNHLLASTLFQTFINEVWVNGNRSFESYNEVNLLTQSRREFWNMDIEDWVLSSQVLYTYEGNDNTATLTQFWDGFNEMWLNNSLLTTIFDADHLKLEEVSKNWINGEWANLFKTSFQYNEANKLVQSEGDLWVEGDWRPQNACDLYWSVLNTAVSKMYKNQIHCRLPNPFQNGQSIHCEVDFNKKNYQVTLFDVNGVAHFYKKTNDINDISLNKQLPSGLYILTIHEEEDLVYRQKLIIEK